MSDPSLDAPASAMLPYVAPTQNSTRLLLFAMRRMAAGGIGDAFAANALIGGFGMGFQRPLVLLRALMAEMSRVASRKLLVAPCCCRRMTEDEARLLAAIAGANTTPNGAALMLGSVLGIRSSLGVLTSAQAVEASFADLGRPLDLVEDGAA